MALFDFRDMDKQRKFILNEPKIELDDNLYTKSGKYGKVQKISFENNYGRVALFGYFDLRNINVGEILRLSKCAIKYDPKFKEMCSKHFQAPKVYIWFNLDPEEKSKFEIHELRLILEKIQAERLDEAEKSKLSMSMTGLRDFNLNDMINDLYENRGEYKYMQQDLNLPPDEDEDSSFQMIAKIEKPMKKFKDETGKDRNYDKEGVNALQKNDEMEISSEDMHKKTDLLVYYGLVVNDNFIDFEKDEEFTEHYSLSNKTSQEKAKNIFPNPYAMKIDKKFLKRDAFNYSFRPCFNHKGEFVTVSSKQNSGNLRISLNIHKICPNNNIISKNSGATSFHDYYKKNTFLYYIDLLSEQLNKKKMVSNQMNVDEQDVDLKKNFSNMLLIEDYSQLLSHYVKNLENFKKHIQEKMSNIQNEVEDLRVLKTIDSYSDMEIRTVKLFAILFLNCFPQKGMLDGGDDISHNEINVKSMRVEVRKMRRRRLVDWLVESKEEEVRNVTKDCAQNWTNPLAIYPLILQFILFGKLKKAIELCFKFGLFELAMFISQTNSETKSTLLRKSIHNWKSLGIYDYIPKDLKTIYSIISKSSDECKDIEEILPLSDWKTLLLTCANYTLSPTVVIPELSNELDRILLKHSNNCKNISPNKAATFDINYLLIKYLSLIETRRSRTESDIILQKLSYSSNIFDKNSDHHLQFMIITILLNSLREAYPSDLSDMHPIEINFTLLKKLHFKLLVKCVEEILCGSEVSNHWKYAIKLIKFSNISARIQDIMIREISCRVSPDVINDEIYKLTGDERLQQLAMGYYQKYQFRFKDAYRSFKNAHEFEQAMEIHITKILCLGIIENNITNDIKDEMEFLSSFYSEKCQRYGKVFNDYLTILTLEEQSKINKIDITFLINLLKRVDTMHTLVPDLSSEKMILCCRNIMAAKLRRILNKILDISSDKAVYHTLTPNLNWVYDEKISLDTKMNEYNLALESFIEMKSRVFNLKLNIV